MNRLRFFLTSALLAIPLSAFSAAPAGVTGITAALKSDGTVHVQWGATEGDVAFYRVYTAEKSILENGGSFDDYEATQGAVTEYSLVDLPSFTLLYVSVLAVSASGEESPFFLEEATVEGAPAAMPPQESSSMSSVPASSVSSEMLVVESSSSASSAGLTPPMQNGGFDLIAIEATSATGVTLTFSHPVTLKTEDAARAFLIMNGSGKILPLKRLIFLGNVMTLVTAPQERGTIYTLSIATSVRGTVAESPLSLDQTENTVTFAGHPDGITPMPILGGSTSSLIASSALEIRRLDLRAKATPSGYTVMATWQPQTGAQVASYEILQSRDGGRTFSSVQRAPGDSLGANITGVTPGAFTLVVRTVDPAGATSRGVLGTIELPEQGKKPTKPAKPTDLPRSGMGMALALLATGAVVGIQRVRRRMAAYVVGV